VFRFIILLFAFFRPPSGAAGGAASASRACALDLRLMLTRLVPHRQD
jgi:hypothetical protein